MDIHKDKTQKVRHKMKKGQASEHKINTDKPRLGLTGIRTNRHKDRQTNEQRCSDEQVI